MVYKGGIGVCQVEKGEYRLEDLGYGFGFVVKG